MVVLSGLAVAVGMTWLHAGDRAPREEKKGLRVVVHVNFADAERQGHGLKNVENVGKLRKRGVRFAACQNTMREKSVVKADLLAGVTTVPSGAAEVIRKQHQGYAYFKP